MRTAARRRAGFTLIELMIVVAMIGILSAIAIPSFLNYQLKSKRSEGFANLSSLATAQKAYFTENGTYVGSLGEPGFTTGTIPAPTKRPFVTTAIPLFNMVGWTPEGNVFFDYDTNDPTLGLCGCTDGCFTAAAYGELDGDGLVSALVYVHAGAQGQTCLTAQGGMLGAPVDPVSLQPQIDTVALSFAADDF